MASDSGRAVGPVVVGVLYGSALTMLALFLFGGGGHGAILLPMIILSSPFSALTPAFAFASFLQWGLFGWLVTTGRRGRMWGLVFLLAHYLGIPLAFESTVSTLEGAREFRLLASQWEDVKPYLKELSLLYLFGQVVAWLAVLRPPKHWDRAKK